MKIDGISNPVQVTPTADLKVIKETLTRMGIVNKTRRLLYPSCYLVEHFGAFYIFHFKELFSVTRSNYYNNLSDEDIHRKNSIVYCLNQWGLIDVEEEIITPHDTYVFVLPHKDKNDYVISHKFNMAMIENIN
tara:strand:- start:111 stop:509 length:399 start_codon:yes stop_codon:yes gene_type:complete